MAWSREKNLLIFLRRTRKKEDTLLVVCNFSNVEYDDFRIGVPYPGKYKEMFNSDAESYGGTGVGNPRVKNVEKNRVRRAEKLDYRKTTHRFLFRIFLYEAGDGRCKQ